VPSCVDSRPKARFHHVISQLEVREVRYRDSPFNRHSQQEVSAVCSISSGNEDPFTICSRDSPVCEWVVGLCVAQLDEPEFDSLISSTSSTHHNRIQLELPGTCSHTFQQPRTQLIHFTNTSIYASTMTSASQRPVELEQHTKSMQNETDPTQSIMDEISSDSMKSDSRHNIRVGYAAHPKDTSSKKYKSGEDAFCIENSDAGLFLAVFDGIGGLHSENIDPADYSHYLAQTCGDFFKTYGQSNLRTLLQKSYEHHAPTGMKGATTVVLAKVHNNNLEVLNLGDSGAMVFRPSGEGFTKVLRTKEQDHRFNAPFNLSTFAGESGHFADGPGDADEYQVKLAPGDVVVLMTDGITDNLFTEQIGGILDSADVNSENFPEKVCQKIIDEADTFSRSNKATPWSTKCGKNGGKPDDMTVVLCQIME